MPNDFYSNEGAGSDANETGAGAEPQQPQEEKAEGETALLPKSIFGSTPPEPGATCTFKVVHVYDDEVEVEYQDDENAEDNSELGKADSALAAMGQPPEAGA